MTVPLFSDPVDAVNTICLSDAGDHAPHDVIHPVEVTHCPEVSVPGERETAERDASSVGMPSGQGQSLAQSLVSDQEQIHPVLLAATGSEETDQIKTLIETFSTPQETSHEQVQHTAVPVVEPEPEDSSREGTQPQSETDSETELGSMLGTSDEVLSAEHGGENLETPCADSQSIDTPVEPLPEGNSLPNGTEEPVPEPEIHNAQNIETDDSFPLWVNGVFQRGEQIGLYNFTTDEMVCGIFLDPMNRWVQLRNRLFVSTPEMAALESKYYQRVEEHAAKTAEQKYVEKTSHLVESEETQKYSKQISFDALDQAHEKYSTVTVEGETVRKSSAGRKPVPFQLALGSLIIQSVLGTSDRGTGIAISESFFLQYFCGFSGFSKDNRISHSKLSELKEVFNASLAWRLSISLRYAS